MAGNKKPRKPHQRKPRQLSIMFGLDAEHARMLQLRAHADLAKLRIGLAGEEEWNTLTCRLNIGLQLAHNHYNVNAEGLLQKALAAMKAIHERQARLAKYGATGDELTTIGDALVLTDDMQKGCTRRELRDAIDHVFKVAAVYPK